MPTDDLLFHKFDSHNLKESLLAQISGAVDQLPDSRLMQGSIDDVLGPLVKEFLVEVPTLALDKVQTEQSEVDIEAGQSARFLMGRDGPGYVRGTEVRFFVPFAGTADLFGCRPSTFDYNPPRAEIGRSELVVRVRGTTNDPAGYKKSFEETIGSINTYLSGLREDLASLEQRLRETARPRLERRREKRTKDAGIVEGLGFPQRDQGKRSH